MRRYLSLPALALPAILGAQRASPPVVAVRVVDSASAPVPGADVSLVRGVSTTVARRRTDAAGRATFAYAPDDSANQIVIRKVGFLRAYQFFAVGSLDTVHVLVRLTRTAVTLAPVKVTAEEDLRRKSYYLTAEDIENSSRTMIDGTDLFKLRPDMMSSRGGPKACEVPWTPRTGWIESVWVNGERVNLTDIDSQYVAGRKPALGIAAPIVRPNPTISQYHAPKPRPLPYTTFSHMDSVLSILRRIHPEHIAEVTYHDCFDASIAKNNADLAMFIVLKPGIAYRPGVGSFVVNDSLARMGGYNVDSLARYRFRVLGVYDGESGEPLNDVEVRDAATGAAARTTPTGTVSLFFVPEGPATLTLHHAGFVDTTVTLTIAPADTVPVTAVLRRTHPPSSESISYIGWKLEGPWRGGRAAEGPGLRYRDSARECSGERYLE